MLADKRVGRILVSWHPFEVGGKREWIRGSRVDTIRTTAIHVIHSVGKTFERFYEQDKLQDEEEANDPQADHSGNGEIRRTKL
jgi:hypothetical protein